MTDSIERNRSIKVNFILSGTFIQPTKDLISNLDFQSVNSVVCVSENLEEFYTSICNMFSIKIEDFELKDSGWSLESVLHLDVNINKYNLLSGSSYINLPMDIKHKKAVINVKNTDDVCFTWALLSALYPVVRKVANRTSSYNQHFDKINMQGVEYPVTLADVGKVEKLNDISINIFKLEYDSNLKKIQLLVQFTTPRKEKNNM